MSAFASQPKEVIDRVGQYSASRKVLFYSSVPRLFRTTYIAHLYEISRSFPVVLIAEALDNESKAALENEFLFPGLDSIVPVDQYTGPSRPLFQAHKHFRSFA